MIYLVIIFLLLFLIVRYDYSDYKKHKNHWYYFVLILIILMLGFRYRLGRDTSNYIYHFYHDYPYLWQLKWDDVFYGSDFAFVLINSIVKSIGGRYYHVQFIEAAIINVLIFKYIKKHSKYIFTCVFFYFIWKLYTLNMEEVRAAMSISICLFANDFVMEKKYNKGIALFLLAPMFHFSALIVLMTPCLFFLKFNKVGVGFLIAAFFIGVSLQIFLKDYLVFFEFNDKLEGKAKSYSSSEGEIVGQLNIFGYIAYLSQCIYSIISILYMKRRKIKPSLSKLEPLLIFGLFLFILTFFVPILVRLFNFYFIYFILYNAELCGYLMNTKSISKGLAYIRMIIIFFPYIFYIFYGYTNPETYPRFLPYSSIFDMKVDMQREQLVEQFRASPFEY